VQRSGHEVDQLAARAQRAGPAALVRAIERLGEILVELRHAPDPRVLVEVALVQLTSAPAVADDDLGAIAARVAKLEQAVAAAASAPPAPPIDPATGRAALGGRARRAATTPPPVVAVVEQTPPAPVAAAAPDAPAQLDDLRAEWEGAVRPALKGIVRALFTPVDVVGVDGTTVSMTTPNETHRAKCDEHRGAVEASWAATTGRAVTVQLAVAGATAVDDGARRGEPEAIDLDELDHLTDAGPGPTALDRLAQAFPGAEVIEGR
jgi:DNA polymerase-3 subunit gamma/tau